MNYKQYAGCVLVLGCLLILLCLPVLLQKQAFHSSDNKRLKRYQSLCKVSEGCEKTFVGGSISLIISPYYMPVMQPLQIDVVVRGEQPQAVSLEFIGRDMPMGLMPYDLPMVPSNKGEFLYQGTAMITFCPVDRHMIWLAQLVIESKTAIKTIVFELEDK